MRTAPAHTGLSFWVVTPRVGLICLKFAVIGPVWWHSQEKNKPYRRKSLRSRP